MSREVKAEHRLSVLETEMGALRRALKLQAREYERRLKALNNENARIRAIQTASVSSEKFDDYKATQETALKIALDRQDDRLNLLENWKSKATGIAVVLALFAGAVGAAITKAIIG